MDGSSPLSSSTVAPSSPPSAMSRDTGALEAAPLDLKTLPPVFVLPTHLGLDELHEFEDLLIELGAPLTYDVREARLVLGKVGTKRRAAMDLRMRGLWTEEVQSEVKLEDKRDAAVEEPARKRRRVEVETRVEAEVAKSIPVVSKSDALDGLSTESEAGGSIRARSATASTSRTQSPEPSEKPASPVAASRVGADEERVKVVKLDWLQDCFKNGYLVSMEPYLVYDGKPVDRPIASTAVAQSIESAIRTPPQPRSPARTVAMSPQSILDRAKADAEATNAKTGFSYSGRKFGENKGSAWGHGKGKPITRTAKLLQRTTTEQEEGGADSDMPEMPEWVKQRRKYACERSTPANPPNGAFIASLKKIREVRELTGDEIGVRAYSTSIAAIAAYPYAITSAREILVLPGCDIKIANLWIEWKNNDGVILEAKQADDDETIQVLRLFYQIWGVGAATAREFYYERGWRDLDDVVEYGWSTLTRVQQIGVKFYDQFLDPIPRAEVEAIAAVIRSHAVSVRDDGIEMVIVGGYRRGNPTCGDVDVVVSHRSLPATANLVTDIVAALEATSHITHTLQLWLTGTHRNQETLAYRPTASQRGRGFDTLDKALVVWQDPHARNPAPRRRVDIIVAPWRTVGCAVAGWSGGTTFQRDLRRFAKNVRGWKFDSSGVRDRATGEVVALEGAEGVGGSMEDAERTVFKGLGLVYREPWERCTG